MVTPLQTVPVPQHEILGIAREFVDTRRYDAAMRLLGHILAVAPDHAEALHLNGYAAFRRGHIDEAAALMERSMNAGPVSARQLCNIAEVYRVLGRLDEGLALITRAVTMMPADPVTHFNEAMLRYDRLELDLCVAAAERAIRLRPDMAEAHMRLGQACLLAGDFARGWQEYEWRYRITGAQPLMPPPIAALKRPAWDGATLSATLLLIADQGFGDVMMFARYIPWARSRCDRVVLACSAELRPTMHRWFDDLQMFTAWTDCPDHAAHCPLSGLPRLHGTRSGNIPTPQSTPPPNSALVATWRDRMDQLAPPGRRRIGIAWAGRPTHNNDANRTIALSRLTPMFDLTNITLVSLQKGPAAKQVAGTPVLDLQIGDFEDTAAVMCLLDLTVTVDTSVAHLAGAASRPCWVLLPYAPDWRWLLVSTNTPWYPSLRLFRQSTPGGWAALIEQVVANLRGPEQSDSSNGLATLQG